MKHWIAVAPNGAYKTKADHPNLPIGPAELARAAAECVEAGAAMMHVHVRDPAGGHLLEAQAYRDVFGAIRQAVGDRLVLQATSEAVGRYGRQEQMRLVEELKPEAVSLAVRELIPDPGAEADAARFLAWARREGIAAQLILYDAPDLARFRDLVARGVIPGNRHSILFVLGRYSAGQRSAPADLLPFLARPMDGAVDWAVCAFGPDEGACGLAAILMGGNARVGFENNLLLADGGLAPSNAASVAQLAGWTRHTGRGLMEGGDLRHLLHAISTA